ncbi:MAG TPA: N-acetylmuramic acid 6-phosphate etherase [Gemmatimonadaceae bacterium]
MAIDPRITEHRNPRTARIDLASPDEIVALMNAEDRTVADAVATQRDAIASAITILEGVFRAGGRLFYVGAGTSGRLGILDASECPPTFGTNPELVQGIIAGGPPAVFRSQEGAEDLPENGEAAINEYGVNAQDCLVGIAASGTTPFVSGALSRAEQLGARTIVIACTPLPPEVTRLTDVAIVAITGPEVVTGSTRLKAGTATKMILNMLTTGAMIRLGKTWGNLMVDLQATNRKLKDRSERILMESCAISRDDARALLEAAGGSVKVAIVMRRASIGREEAARRISAAHGIIRHVVGDP